MNIMQNKKGVTLIELVVVMLITVILLGVVGSIFISSSSFFQKTIASDMDKVSTDKISEFVRSELLYASAVEMSETPKDERILQSEGWNYFYVNKDNARLYHNSTSDGVYSDSFYNGRLFKMTSRGYENYRMDLRFQLDDRQHQEVYKNENTIVLPNLKLDEIQTGKKWFDIDFVNSKLYDSSIASYYIYYKKTTSRDTGLTGTVADQKYCKDNADWIGKFYGFWRTNQKYERGDFVYVEDTLKPNTPMLNEYGDPLLFRFITDYGSSGANPILPNSGEQWKLLSPIYTILANYYQGDIVKYPNKDSKEYIMYAKRGSIYPSNKDDGYRPDKNGLGVWVPVYPNTYAMPDVSVCDVAKAVEYTADVNIMHTFIYDTPYEKLYKSGLIPERDAAKFTPYVQGNRYPASNPDKLTEKDIVVYGNEYYINISGSATSTTPGELDGSQKYVWQKLQTTYSPASAYQKGDVVLITGSDGNIGASWEGVAIYRALKDINTSKQFIISEWQRIRWDTTQKEWIQKDF